MNVKHSFTTMSFESLEQKNNYSCIPTTATALWDTGLSDSGLHQGITHRSQHMGTPPWVRSWPPLATPCACRHAVMARSLPRARIQAHRHTKRVKQRGVGRLHVSKSAFFLRTCVHAHGKDQAVTVCRPARCVARGGQDLNHGPVASQS